MFYLPQRTRIFIVGSYLVLSAVPFFPLCLGKDIPGWKAVVGYEVFAWLSVWAVFKRPGWFHWLLLPAYLAVPIELYLQLYYGQGISTHHLGIIAETSPQEAIEFLGSGIWLFVFVICLMIAWWWLGAKAARRSEVLNWTGTSRWVMLVVLTAAALTGLYEHQHGAQPVASSASADRDDAEEDDPATPGASQSLERSGKVLASALPALPRWAKVPFQVDSFAESWPFGLTVVAHDFWMERRYLAELAQKSQLFTFGAHQPHADTSPEVVVVVIGESSRYDRWSVNGYKRETNPLLKKESNLVTLSNVVTAVSATRLSVPVLVSRKPAMQSLKAGFSEKSFLSAFKEAGFKTYWLSNQLSFGQFDTPISVFAKEAEVTEFLNFGGFTDNSSYDEILLAPLRHAINDPAHKKLIVLHTLGSHWNYSHRYPKEFDRWQPSLFGIDKPTYTDVKLKPHLNNSYDNSVLYTDWFLSQVIDVLKATDRSTAMMYVSDHGQTLYDGSCNLAFHGHNTQYEFHVPALVWYSDLYRLSHPGKIRQLRRNKHARLATENVFHSLLDLADIRYGTEQLEWSFLNPGFKPHKRYVDSYGWTDYDNATFRGDCREVIDRGRPLAQVK